MAITNENFSVEGVQDILSRGESALSSLNANDKQSNLLLTIDRLKQKIIYLQQVEDKMLSLFPAPNDRESVRSKIIKYNNTNFNYFFGVDLWEMFIKEFSQSVKAVNDSTKKEQNLLATFLMQEIVNKASFQAMLPNSTKEEIAAAAISEFHNLLSRTTGGSNRATKTRKTYGMINVSGKGQNAIPQLVVDGLTKPMRIRLQQILNQLNNPKGKYNYKFPNLSQVNISNFNASKNNLTIQVQSEWLSITEGLTPTQIKDRVEKDTTGAELQKVRQANNKIIVMLCKVVGPEAKAFTRQYLLNLSRQDPYIFFVGKSSTDVTGLLGEIAAVVAIQQLTGQTVPVEWIAHNMSNGKKVSVDVVLNYCFGINVKNTTQDFSQYKGFHDVSFVERNPQDILESLLHESTISENLSDAFQTSYFNLSYQIISSRPHVIPYFNDNFDNVEIGLLSFRKKLITFLYQFAPELMYMATDELDKQLLILDNELEQNLSGKGNILYMVGGVPFFPSEMLTDLMKDLQSLEEDLKKHTNFRDKSFFFNVGHGNSTTIVDILNERAQAGKSVALRDFTYDKTLTIQMTSSWLF